MAGDGWQSDLDSFFERSQEDGGTAEQTTEFGHFIATVVIPAFEQVAREFEKHGRYVTIRNTEASAVIIINHKGEEELSYRIQSRVFPSSTLPYAEVRFRERKGPRIISVESMVRSGPSDYNLADVTADEIVQSLVSHYTQRVQQRE